jgi:aminoglycoside phosphotransferase (APT) family kinase protein
MISIRDATIKDMFERSLSTGQIAAMLSRAGVNWDQVTDAALLDGGSFNSVYRVALTDGSKLILKAAPPAEMPALRHEHGLLRSETLFYTLAAGRGVAGVPTMVYDGGEFFLLMTELPGQPWPEVEDRLTDSQRQRLRADVGRLVAGLHTITGTSFGYPSHALGPLAATWRAAFGGMLDAVLADVESFGATLPVSPAAIRELTAGCADALDEVTTPVLVHFDLWDGNILVDSSGGTPRIGGLIDAERAFWGDPLADFVSLAMFSDIRQDQAFLDGYRRAGGPVLLDASSEVRLALYRSYIYLLLLAEITPRTFTPAERQEREATVVPALATELGILRDRLA